jgi:hypothetical protein
MRRHVGNTPPWTNLETAKEKRTEGAYLANLYMTLLLSTCCGSSSSFRRCHLIISLSLSFSRCRRCCCCRLVIAVVVVSSLSSSFRAHIPREGRGIAGAWGTPLSLMWQLPLTLEDQARTDTRVVRPPPAHGAMTRRGVTYGPTPLSTFQAPDGRGRVGGRSGGGRKVLLPLLDPKQYEHDHMIILLNLISESI